MSIQESIDKIIGAELAERLGDKEQAQKLYREAAKMQQAFVKALPSGRVNTRSMYSFSAAVLLFRAGDLDDAELYADMFLCYERLETSAADGLRDLLMDIQAARGREARRAKVQEPTTEQAYVVTFDNPQERKNEIVEALCSTGFFSRAVAEHVTFHRGCFVTRHATFARRVNEALKTLRDLNVVCALKEVKQECRA